MIAVKLVYKYLQAAKDLGIIYQVRLTEKPYFEIYTDADLTGDKKTQKSTFGYVVILARYLIS